MLNAAATEPDYIGFGKQTFKHQELKQSYIDNKGFDPDGFFFITYRSMPIGLTLALPTQEEGEWVIPYLTAIPNYFGRGVEKCLLFLIL